MMWFSILIAIASLVVLFVVHEFGHFILARLFGMPVEEFGLGLPPRITSWEINDITYSLNWIPFGAFVSIRGEDDQAEEGPSFNKYPLWQRIVVYLGGVVATWIVAAILYSIVAGVWGLPGIVGEQADIPSAEVRVTRIETDSVAEEAEVIMGDHIVKAQYEQEQVDVKTVGDVRTFINQHDAPIQLTVIRGGEETTITLPVSEKDNGQNLRGLHLTRLGYRQFSWHEAPKVGLLVTARQTVAIPVQLSQIAYRYFAKGVKTPGVKLMGPIGIGKTLSQAAEVGFNYLLQFVALIALYLSIFNFIPLPALDGGKILFALIGGIRGQKIDVKVENTINNIFFFLLIALLFWVTFKDILRLVT